jgi:arylsulfatase A-like enzyme
MSTPKVSRRDFMKTTCVSTLALTLPRYLSADNGTRRGSGSRPNIVLIMADDMGFSDLACYGGGIHTPNLDRLAANGVRFTQFYNTARCCPSRASLMTGLYAHQTGVGHMMGDYGVEGYRGDLNDRCVTIAEVLRQTGYATYMSGKWHVTNTVGHWTGDDKLTSKHNWPRQRGFDRFYGTIAGGGSYFDPVALVRDNMPVEPETETYYYTDAIADSAVRFINDHIQYRAKEPFFCYIAYTAPHWPLHALPEDIARYKGRYDSGWDALRAERYRRMLDMGVIGPECNLTPRDAKAPPWEEAEDKPWQVRRMEVYAAQVDRMDQNIGKIIQCLTEIGKLDNTLILFLSDNGGCAEELGPSSSSLSRSRTRTRDGRPVRAGNNDHSIMPGPADTYQSYGLPWANASNTPFRRYKHWVHEGGIATPLIAHWPHGISGRGRFCQQPGHVIDIMATCVDIAGARYPAEYDGRSILSMEGKSLRPVFEDRTRQGHEAIFWEHEGNRAVRRGRWKLVSQYPRKWELYDIDTDRSELNDLAAKHPALVNELSAAYKRWAERCHVEPWDQLMELRRKQRRSNPT